MGREKERASGEVAKLEAPWQLVVNVAGDKYTLGPPHRRCHYRRRKGQAGCMRALAKETRGRKPNPKDERQ
ncbi:hypothetical protein TIFTF001_004646 [Ficus carica]|uniref:Uncharacterized protein n=1 Tax=Ficus carica TaxID=3494 RepID=A0AA88DDC2_FICCA|nr:hypothetical protein TIFTF001_004646 [Ficus carica]